MSSYLFINYVLVQNFLLTFQLCSSLVLPLYVSYHKKLKCLLEILSLHNKYKIQLIKYSLKYTSKLINVIHNRNLGFINFPKPFTTNEK